MDNQMKKYQELLGGIIFLATSVFYYVNAFSIKELGSSKVNSQFFPKLIGGTLILLSIYTIFRGIKKLKEEKDIQVTSNPINKTNFLRVVLTAVLLLIYIAFLKSVGFLIMTILYTILQMIILTPKEKRNYIQIIIISVVFSLIVYAIFLYGFQLMLPRGILS